MTGPRMLAPRGARNRSTLQRHLDRATAVWLQGRPYQAAAILRDAGLEPFLALFLRTCATWARAHPQAMARHRREHHRSQAAPR